MKVAKFMPCEIKRQYFGEIVMRIKIRKGSDVKSNLAAKHIKIRPRYKHVSQSINNVVPITLLAEKCEAINQ